MAGPSSSTSKANNNSNSRITIISPLPHPPGHANATTTNNNPLVVAAKKPVRRVSFSEIPTKHYEFPNNNRSSRRSGGGGGGGDGRGCYSCCCMCCMWFCLILLFFFFIVALGGALFLGYFQPKLPVVRIERINFPMLNISTTSSPQQNYLSTDIELFILVWNVNEKIEFSYSPLTVYVTSGIVNLGKTEVPGFSQLGLNNMTVLKVHTGVSHSVVDNEEGEKLRRNYYNSRRKGVGKVNVDVVLSGAVRFIFTRQIATTRLPIAVLCKNINVDVSSRVGLGVGDDQYYDEPQCKVELFSFPQQQQQQQQVTTTNNNNNNQPNVF